MVALLAQLLLAIRSRFTRRARLEAENLLLRQQLVVLRRKYPKRLRLWNIDRLLLVWLYRLYPALLDAIIIVQPETVLRWHRRGFCTYWRWKSRHVAGRPRIDSDIRALIRRMSRENPLWGAPRIHGELLMLGIEVAEINRKQVYGAAPPTTVPRLEDFPAESRCRHRFAGSVRGAHDLVPAALRPGDPASRPQAPRNNQRHLQSDRRVDRWSGNGWVSLGRSTPSPDSRPRRGLRPSLRPSHSGHGDPRPSDHAALTVMAERPRRTDSRVISKRLRRGCGTMSRTVAGMKLLFWAPIE